MTAVSRRSYWWMDLVLAIAFVLAGVVVLLIPGVPWVVEWVFGIPFLLFLPGYAVVTALFPRTSKGYSHLLGPDPSPDQMVQLALSLAISAFIVAVTGVALSATVGIKLVPIVLAIGTISSIGIIVAMVRRLLVHPEQRAEPFSRLRSAVGVIFDGSTVQSAVLILMLLVLFSTIAYAGTVPSEDESFSEFYLLTEGATGSLVADSYPTTFVAGEGHRLFFAIANHEHRPVTYGVVTIAQRLGPPNRNVIEQQHVDSFRIQIPDGERRIVERTIDPTLIGDNVRLQVLLYKGDVPDDPSRENSDLSLHLWIDIAEE